MFYIHPWEYDPLHPSVGLNWKSKITHYTNLSTTLARTERMLNEFKFVTVSDYIDQYAKQQPIITIPVANLQD